MEASNIRSAYSINSQAIPSPPSPAASSPSLTQSTSNSSSSPPHPTTPPRRSIPRYADPDRVPLHRRGKSKTYECLEDLLREAGYKETRVFTPESDKHGERSVRDGEDFQSGGGKKQGVGAAVVGFITGLVTGGNTSAIGAKASTDAVVPDSRQDSYKFDDNSDQLLRPSRNQSPSSPLANRISQRQQRWDGSGSTESSGTQTPIMTSSIESLNDSTPKAYRRHPFESYTAAQNHLKAPPRPTTPSVQSPHQYQYHAPMTTTRISPYNHQPSQYRHRRLSAAQHQLQTQASWSSIQTYTSIGSHSNSSTAPATVLNDEGTSFRGLASGSGNVTGVNVIQHPRPSHVGNHLCHKVSTSSIHPQLRPNSTSVHHDPSWRQSGSDDENKVVVQPPLPRNWLENVARAVLFGTAFSTSSDPSCLTPPSSQQHDSPHLPTRVHQRSLRLSRSSLSQTTISRDTKRPRRSGLSDQTNTSLPLHHDLNHTLMPPALFTKLERGRAPCSQGVSRAQVVCRSAPASRASSLVRHGPTSGFGSVRHRGSDFKPGEDLENDGWGRKQGRNTRSGMNSSSNSSGSGSGWNRARRTQPKSKPKSKSKKTKQKSSAEQPRVPSLTRTHISGDEWQVHRVNSNPSFSSRLYHHHHHLPQIRVLPRGHRGGLNRHLDSADLQSFSSNPYSNSRSSGTHKSPYPRPSSPSYTISTSLQDYDEYNSDLSDSNSISGSDDDDEGELTLAKMLIPPKPHRQQSIQSLRKHLQLHHQRQHQHQDQHQRRVAPSSSVAVLDTSLIPVPAPVPVPDICLIGASADAQSDTRPKPSPFQSQLRASSSCTTLRPR